MAKYHINSNGDAGPCRASSGKCPFGGEADHYASAAEARAAFEAQMGGGFAAAASDPLAAASYDVPEELREAGQRVLDRYKVNAAGQFSLEDMPPKEVQAYLALSDEERAARQAAEDSAAAALVPQVDFGAIMGTPCKLTRKEANALRKGLQEHGLTEDDFNAFLVHDNAHLFGGRGGLMHPTRLQKLALKRNFGDDFATAAYIFNADHRAAEQARVAASADPHGVEARILAVKEEAREAFYGKDDSEAVAPAHAYGSWMGRNARHEVAIDRAARAIAQAQADAACYDNLAATNPQRRKAAKELANESRQKAERVAKELDPAMIEALKLKYLKRFKVPFDESGLSVGELLQMAQRGELG